MIASAHSHPLQAKLEMHLIITNQMDHPHTRMLIRLDFCTSKNQVVRAFTNALNLLTLKRKLQMRVGSLCFLSLLFQIIPLDLPHEHQCIQTTVQVQCIFFQTFYMLRHWNLKQLKYIFTTSLQIVWNVRRIRSEPQYPHFINHLL